MAAEIDGIVEELPLTFAITTLPKDALLAHAIKVFPAGKGDPARLVPSLAGQPPGYLKDQMLLFKQDKRNPGDATLSAMKALMHTIPDDTYGDLAAYYSSLR